jgi:aminopeptidase-like protein
MPTSLSSHPYPIWKLLAEIDPMQVGAELHDFMAELYPLCRSITGEGVRETLHRVNRIAGLEIHEVPSGTQAFDWTVPKEWNIRDAYIADLQGHRLVDFRDCNLHVVGYSIPIHRRVSRDELFAHLHSDEAHPDWIPYRNSYYQEDWGFCVSHNQRASLNDDEYEVCIDSTLAPGSLTYGEAYLPGESEQEILISTHVCHPSLGNDNLSGIAVAAWLAKALRTINTRYSFRFLFLPCTIGPIVWLNRHMEHISRIKHGLVLACLGDPGTMTYIQSRRGNADIDHAVAHVLKHSGEAYETRPFTPYGYDQRQYCSPGFNLPMGCLMRTPNGEYPQYHTSADNLALVQPQALADSFTKILSILGVVEDDRRYLAQVQYGEPQLGRRGLYHKAKEFGLFWLLNFSDGEHSVLDIAEKSGLPFHTLAMGVNMLKSVGLLSDVEGNLSK